MSVSQWCEALPATGSGFEFIVVAVSLVITGGLALLLRRAPAVAVAVAVIVGVAIVAPAGEAGATGRPECSLSIDAAAVADLPPVESPVGQEAVAPGSSVEWSLGGFAPIEAVFMVIAPSGGTLQVIDQEMSDRGGQVDLEGVLPAGLTSGQHTLLAIAPESGIGVRTRIEVDASLPITDGPRNTATPSTVPAVTTPSPQSGTTTTVPPSTTTTTAPTPSTTTTTTTAPSGDPTTTTTTTTTTVPGSSPPQTVTWAPDTEIFITDSPEMPTRFPVSDGSGAITYSIDAAGTTGCTVDASSGEISYSSTGTCTVRATAAATSNEGAGSTTVSFTIDTPVCGPKPSYSVGNVGPGGGRIVHEASTCQSWGWFLEVAPADWSGTADGSYRPLWCDNATPINGAKGSRLGAGAVNTATVNAACSEGATVDAAEYRGGGFVDWYLPSSLEWHQVCRWVHANSSSQGGGTRCVTAGWSYTNNIGFADHYWTSTQTDHPNAIENWMYGGDDFRTVDRSTTYVSARPVRAFGSTGIQAGIRTAVRRSTSRTISMTADFSTTVSGLTSADFSNAGTAPGCVFTPASSSGSSIAVQVVCAGDGTVVAALAADAVSVGSATGPRRAVNSSMIPIDSIAPTVSTTGRTVVSGTGLDASVDERGTLYVVDETVAPTSAADITAAADASWNTSGVVDAGVRHVNTAGLTAGTYRVWAVDLAGNLSAASTDALVVRAPVVCSTSCLIGDTGPGGGTVVYDAGSLQSWGRYLEVAPENWSGGADGGYRPLWCDTETDVPAAAGTAIGDGRANSQAMAAACPTGAAVDAREYRGAGFTDWHLASSAEWHQVCRWVHANSPSQGGGNDCEGMGWSYVNNSGYADHYWTSTLSSPTNAIENWMYGGNDFRSVSHTTGYVSARPVRVFGGPDVPDATIVPAVRRSTTRNVSFTVHFDRAVSGLTSSDFDNAGTATGCVFTPASPSGTSVVVSTTCATDGTITARLAADAVTDGTASGPAAAVNSSVVPVDSTAPTVVLSESGAVTVVQGASFGATLDERGTVYIVDSSVAVTRESDITSAADAAWNSLTVSTASDVWALSTTGLSPGSYTVIGVDLAGNLTVDATLPVTVRAPQACSTTCLVGDIGPGGGTVVYDAGSVQSWGRYLEVAPVDWSGGADGAYRPVWCDTPAAVSGASGTAIGDGAANTAAMVAGCTSGAGVDAAAYRGGGLSDWFLPSADEQREVCKLAHGNYRGISTCATRTYSYVNDLGFTDHYWTSSQVSATTAIETWMYGANDYRTVATDTTYVSARPMRSF